MMKPAIVNDSPVSHINSVVRIAFAFTHEMSTHCDGEFHAGRRRRDRKPIDIRSFHGEPPKSYPRRVQHRSQGSCINTPKSQFATCGCDDLVTQSCRSLIPCRNGRRRALTSVDTRQTTHCCRVDTNGWRPGGTLEISQATSQRIRGSAIALAYAETPGRLRAAFDR